MNYDMYLNFLSKSEDKLFWKKEYLNQLTTKRKTIKDNINYKERQIEIYQEAIKKYVSEIIELELHIKEVESMKVD
jgi:Na+/phosphate symporter